MNKLKPGLNKCTNAEYHGDSEYLSSSSLKLLLTDAEQFYREKILGQPREAKSNQSSLDDGSYVHSLILEPENIESEYAFFPGWDKRDSAFKQFKEENPGKICISKSQKMKCAKYLEAFNSRPEAKALISGGEAEQTICGDILGVPIKVRFDYINVDKGYIADIKTTSYSADRDTFALTSKGFQYELSAALYLKVAEMYYGKPFSFYFITISKKDNVCEVFKLSSATREAGNVQVMAAINKYKRCKSTGLWLENHVIINPEGDYEIHEI